MDEEYTYGFLSLTDELLFQICEKIPSNIYEMRLTCSRIGKILNPFFGSHSKLMPFCPLSYTYNCFNCSSDDVIGKYVKMGIHIAMKF